MTETYVTEALIDSYVAKVDKLYQRVKRINEREEYIVNHRANDETLKFLRYHYNHLHRSFGESHFATKAVDVMIDERAAEVEKEAGERFDKEHPEQA